MKKKKKVLAISGSTRKNSSNLMILHFIKNQFDAELDLEIYDRLAELPHFNPDLDQEDPPLIVQELRNLIKGSDGVIFCTPEYVFSLPGSLKNAIEWCVSTTVFSEMPVAIITASGLGEKAHESLQLIMKTIYARTDIRTQLLLQGARGKINAKGEFTDQFAEARIKELVTDFIQVMEENKVAG